MKKNSRRKTAAKIIPSNAPKPTLQPHRRYKDYCIGRASCFTLLFASISNAVIITTAAMKNPEAPITTECQVMPMKIMTHDTTMAASIVLIWVRVGST